MIFIQYPSIYLISTSRSCFIFSASMCFSSRATKNPCVRVVVVPARRHWVSGSRPRSGHWAKRGTNLEEKKHRSIQVTEIFHNQKEHTTLQWNIEVNKLNVQQTNYVEWSCSVILTEEIITPAGKSILIKGEQPANIHYPLTDKHYCRRRLLLVQQK